MVYIIYHYVRFHRLYDFARHERGFYCKINYTHDCFALERFAYKRVITCKEARCVYQEQN
jgi:hypothetical protein